MPSGHFNRAIWAAMVIAIVWLGWQYRDTYFNSQGTLEVSTDGSRDTLYLAWSGKIAPPMREKIAAAVAEHGAGRRTVILSLNSPGGLLGYGDSVNALLREIAATHTLETTVETGNACASMCVPVYLQGEVRRASGRSRWLFHEVRRHDVLKDGPEDTRPEVRRALTDKLFDTYFVPAGIPPGWIRDIRGQMQGGTDVWRTGAQLIEQQAGIVLERL